VLEEEEEEEKEARRREISTSATLIQLDRDKAVS